MQIDKTPKKYTINQKAIAKRIRHDQKDLQRLRKCQNDSKLVSAGQRKQKTLETIGTGQKDSESFRTGQKGSELVRTEWNRPQDLGRIRKIQECKKRQELIRNYQNDSELVQRIISIRKALKIL